MTYATLADAVKGMVGFMLRYGTIGFSVDILNSAGAKISNCYLTRV